MHAFEHQTAFITGGAQGIGLGIARQLARRGARLVITDIDEARLAVAQEELGQLSPTSTYVLDVRDRQAFERIAEDAEDHVGPVSLLFNNAGVAGVGSLSYDNWDWVIDVNLKGVINGVQCFLSRMQARGQPAHIINTASVAGVIGSTMSSPIYNTSKYAVVGLSEALRWQLEQGGSPVSVSVLCPGAVATDIISNTLDAKPGDTHTLREGDLGQALSQAQDMLLDQGLDTDQVGELVIQGMLENAPFIFTDRSVAQALSERTQIMLACMPAPQEH